MHIRNVRVAAGALAVVAVLAVSGCSGGGGGGGDAKEKGQGESAPSGGSSSSGSGAGSGSDSGSDSSSSSSSVKDAEGIWKATSGGKPVVLVVGEKQAALTTADGHLCTGTLAGTGKPTLTLRCADGNTDRTKGTVESNDGAAMRISWGAGKTDTFKKSKDGELPTALPSGLPTN